MPETHVALYRPDAGLLNHFASQGYAVYPVIGGNIEPLMTHILTMGSRSVEEMNTTHDQAIERVRGITALVESEIRKNIRGNLPANYDHSRFDWIKLKTEARDSNRLHMGDWHIDVSEDQYPMLHQRLIEGGFSYVEGLEKGRKERSYTSQFENEETDARLDASLLEVKNRFYVPVYREDLRRFDTFGDAMPLPITVGVEKIK